MIRTVAEFLLDLKDVEAARLKTVSVRHGPTIGEMYEGLSADLLGRAIPSELGLEIVRGFVSDGAAGQSQQIDCMLVLGEGDRIPYTDSYVWLANDVIAVFEIKKSLFHDDLVDAVAKLRSVKDVAAAQRIARRYEQGTVNVRSAQRAFAEATRIVAPDHEHLEALPLEMELLLHTLVSEQLNPVGIVIGYEGYATEAAFRESLVRHLTNQVDASKQASRGYGPTSFPQLMISGRFSLGKANGQPYSSRLTDDGWWPFLYSSRVNPLLLMLEYVWTKLDREFGIGGLWGDDLTIERLSPFLLARATQENGVTGWRYEFVERSERELDSSDAFEAWQPTFLSMEQFVVINQLCAGRPVVFTDHELLAFLKRQKLDPEELKRDLLDTGLVGVAGNGLELITSRCQPAVLPDGRFVAGEDNSGRMTRWLDRHMARRDASRRTQATE